MRQTRTVRYRSLSHPYSPHTQIIHELKQDLVITKDKLVEEVATAQSLEAKKKAMQLFIEQTERNINQESESLRELQAKAEGPVRGIINEKDAGIFGMALLFEAVSLTNLNHLN